MNTAAVTALLAGKEPVRALVLASEKEVAELADLGLPVNTVDSSLSMQHLAGYGSGAGADLCDACALP